jgi:hypothetical protein
MERGMPLAIGSPRIILHYSVVDSRGLVERCR